MLGRYAAELSESVRLFGVLHGVERNVDGSLPNAWESALGEIDTIDHSDPAHLASDAATDRPKCLLLRPPPSTPRQPWRYPLKMQVFSLWRKAQELAHQEKADIIVNQCIACADVHYFSVKFWLMLEREDACIPSKEISSAINETEYGRGEKPYHIQEQRLMAGQPIVACYHEPLRPRRPTAPPSSPLPPIHHPTDDDIARIYSRHSSGSEDIFEFDQDPSAPSPSQTKLNIKDLYPQLIVTSAPNVTFRDLAPLSIAAGSKVKAEVPIHSEAFTIQRRVSPPFLKGISKIIEFARLRSMPHQQIPLRRLTTSTEGVTEMETEIVSQDVANDIQKPVEKESRGQLPPVINGTYHTPIIPPNDALGYPILADPTELLILLGHTVQHFKPLPLFASPVSTNRSFLSNSSTSIKSSPWSFLDNVRDVSPQGTGPSQPESNDPPSHDSGGEGVYFSATPPLAYSDHTFAASGQITPRDSEGPRSPIITSFNSLQRIASESGVNAVAGSSREMKIDDDE